MKRAVRMTKRCAPSEVSRDCWRGMSSAAVRIRLLKAGLLAWLAVLCAVGCGGPSATLSSDGAAEATVPTLPLARPNPPPSPFVDEIIYFVMVDRFDNGDRSNDYGGYGEGLGPERDADAHVLRHGFKRDHPKYFHGGDLAGLRRRLGYIKRLGATALWLSPVMKNKPVHATGNSVAASNACYHGYCPLDFERIDPHLGTESEFRELVRAAHDAGLKIYLDVVANHTADVIHYADCPDRRECAYVPVSTAPYKDAAGEPFSLAPFHRREPKRPFPELSLASFPRRPVVDEMERFAKRPLFLNNPIYYHNRGVSSFEGESARLGDFYILDDLFSAHPQVIEGMSEVYARWVSTYGIDGMRLDAARHVDPVFWRHFVPAMRSAAKSRTARGGAAGGGARAETPFFVFGEVFDNQPAHLSDAMKESGFDAVLDFGFHGAALATITGDAGPNVMALLFAQDDYYTHADGDARSLPTFVSNHDVGRLGAVLRRNYPRASEETLLARASLGHALMFLSRGVPVIYYGDEQGFTGGARHGGGVDIGDAAARQDMFESWVADYRDPALNRTLGKESTPGADNFDESHPLYRQMQMLAGLRRRHPTLARGVQIARYSDEKPGLLAFAREDDDGAYLVVFNTADAPSRATFSVSPGTAELVEIPVSPGAPARVLETDEEGRVDMALDAFAYAVFEVHGVTSSEEVHAGLQVVAPRHDYASGQFFFEVALAADAARYGIQRADDAPTVHFTARWGGQARALGVDRVAPYRVRFDASEVPSGTTVELAAEAFWPSGVQRAASRSYVVEARPVDVHLRYENGNARTSAFALANDGRFAGPFDVSTANGATGDVSFTVEPGERTLSVFFESRDTASAGFDVPIHLDVFGDLYPRAAEDESGQRLSVNLHVSNDGTITSAPAMASSHRPATLVPRFDAVGVPLFLRGSMNGWSTHQRLARSDGRPLAVTLRLEGTVAFKFADDSWSRFNAGAPFTERGLTLGGASSNLFFDAGKGGEYQVELMFFEHPSRIDGVPLVVHRIQTVASTE